VFVITPDGRTLYAANWGKPGMVTPISTASKKPGHAIGTGIYPSGMVITPDGRTVYVTNLGSNTVTPISTATNKAGHAIRTGKTPVAIAITP
jgi:hyaluronoglucosaminidase